MKVFTKVIGALAVSIKRVEVISRYMSQHSTKSRRCVWFVPSFYS